MPFAPAQLLHARPVSVSLTVLFFPSSTAFGRRPLLLITFPLMSLFLLMTGMGFFIPETSKARIAVIALGIYLHCMAYSPGEGFVFFSFRLSEHC